MWVCAHVNFEVETSFDFVQQHEGHFELLRRTNCLFFETLEALHCDIFGICVYLWLGGECAFLCARECAHDARNYIRNVHLCHQVRRDEWRRLKVRGPKGKYFQI